MSTKSKKIKNNNTKNSKTKKNKIVYILTEKEKTLNQIIVETKNRTVNDNLFLEMENFFSVPFSKKAIYLSKNDYYNYINELWIKNIVANKKQMKFLIKLDDFRVIQYRVFENLEDIINNYIAKKSSVVATELKNFSESALKFNSLLSSKNYLKKTIDYIDLLRKDKKNLWKMLAFINKNEFTNPFAPLAWSFSPDKKNSSKYVNYMDPHNFAIFDLSVYEDSSYTEKERNIYAIEYKKFFIKLLKKMFGAVIPDDKSLKAEDVFDVAKDFFELMGKVDNNIVESPDYYNKVTAEESIKKYKFDWNEYCMELGYEKNKIPQFFIVSNLSYFKFCTEEMLNNWNSDKWRSFWIWIIGRFATRFTASWHEIFYSFYGKETQGLLESIRKSVVQGSVLLTTYAFNPLLNNEYIDFAYNEQNVVYSTNLANDLKNIFLNRLNRNEWLEPKTKKYAIFKVQKIDLVIGSKKFDADYDKILPLLDFNPDEFIDNLLKVSAWRHNLYVTNQIDIIETLVMYDFNTYPFKITNLPSYVVNAQYLTYDNAIHVSTAYLQKPFINIVEQGFEYNLAYIGFTIAHELSHSLDDNGSQFDVNGNMNNWWTKKDKIKFEDIQKEIIKQYEVFSEYDGLKYDVSYTIGEDMADIVGLKICEEYLRDFCIQNSYTPFITFLHFRMFYVYFAYQMRQKIREKSIRYELITNPHAMDKYRTNVTLSRSTLFKAMYNIKKGDKMYWKNKYNNVWD